MICCALQFCLLLEGGFEKAPVLQVEQVEVQGVLTYQTSELVIRMSSAVAQEPGNQQQVGLAKELARCTVVVAFCGVPCGVLFLSRGVPMVASLGPYEPLSDPSRRTRADEPLVEHVSQR